MQGLREAEVINNENEMHAAREADMEFQKEEEERNDEREAVEIKMMSEILQEFWCEIFKREKGDDIKKDKIKDTLKGDLDIKLKKTEGENGRNCG